jgi:hypothetical protein
MVLGCPGIANFPGKSLPDSFSVIVHFNRASGGALDVTLIQFCPWMLLVEGANLTLKIGTTVEADFKYFHCTENSGDIFSLSRNIPDRDKIFGRYFDYRFATTSYRVPLAFGPRKLSADYAGSTIAETTAAR